MFLFEDVMDKQQPQIALSYADAIIFVGIDAEGTTWNVREHKL